MRAAITILCVVFSLSSYAQQSEITSRSWDKVAQDISGHDSQINQQRLNEFKQNLAQQQALLKQSQQRLAAAEQRQQQLKASFDNNEQRLTEQQQLLTQRTGQLGEVFGVIKQQASEAQGALKDSLVSAQFPQREQRLAFADQARIPSLEEFKALWVTLHHELSESGKTVRFQREVVSPSGQSQSRSLLRLGNFQLIDQEGQFLRWQSQLNQVQVLPRQPSASAVSQAKAFVNSQQPAALLVDVTRGQLLAMLEQTPDLLARLKQGGVVAYIILGLGAIGLLMALWRIVALWLNELKVKRQLANIGQLNTNNPLGRVLTKAQHSDLAVDDLSLRIEEAILEEMPGLERGQSLIKLFAAVAPLLGLLGTVTGMIGTFQSITLFGTSDPKLMAGGISQALITTVVGLIVAIPLLFSHNLLSTRTRRILQILQQKSTALLADRREQRQDFKDAA
ncbi:MotA/TolQ/ExbB proton channel family protein [Agarivorans sp.]|uniref:MotA/TolQ/ExbB proton channel family protein n=1 Tax=Agarivorans sp. TaxID=1872412 RepID=UPI003D0406C1